jgi:hypothetical protein
MRYMTKDNARTLAHDVFQVSPFELNSGYFTAKEHAQKNLTGKTHYVDPDTLRYHKSRILESYSTDHGTLFALIESCALDMHNKSRGFRFVVFDLGGQSLGRASLEDAYKTKASAEKAMWAWLDDFDVVSHYIERLGDDLRRIGHKADAINKLVRGMESGE